MKNKNYTVKHSIDFIDMICEEPEKYLSELQGALNDAKVHYENKNVSEEWYDSTKRILESYIK